MKGKVPSAPEVFCNNQLENIRAVLNVASGTEKVRIEGVLSKDLLDYTVLRRLTYEADGHRYMMFRPKKSRSTDMKSGAQCSSCSPKAS